MDEREAARFAFLPAPDLRGFSVGTDAYPDRSATVVAATRFAGGAFILSGPGIPGRERRVDLSLPGAAIDQLAANRVLYPRGVDLLLLDGDRLMGLPRTTAVRPAPGAGA